MELAVYLEQMVPVETEVHLMEQPSLELRQSELQDLMPLLQQDLLTWVQQRIPDAR